MKISVVINTFNEEKNIVKAINSVLWADEVIVCDMHSSDKTVHLAEKLGARVIFHDYTRYVEPARNFAIDKAKNDWILILDADEEIPNSLHRKLVSLIEDKVDYIQIPRKNIIFDKWLKNSMWWPDYNIRFFKKGQVTWSDKIHSKPKVSGKEVILDSIEDLAIIHNHYTSISQFIERLNRYTSIQAEQLKSEGYNFKWPDLINKPLNEFLSRFFANKGFEDGLHGLALALLQAFSLIVMYLKVWELEKFEQKNINLSELEKTVKDSGKDLNYWFKYSKLSKNPIKRVFQKIGNKIS